MPSSLPRTLTGGADGGGCCLVLAGRVVAGGQQAYRPLERDFTGQLEASLLAGDFDIVDGQRRGDVTAPGVDGGQPPGADLC